MEGLLNASIAVLLPNTVFFLVGGTVLGVILGAVPGITGAMGIALLLPMTFYMTANNALTMMVAMYVGAIAGGLVTAVLLQRPLVEQRRHPDPAGEVEDRAADEEGQVEVDRLATLLILVYVGEHNRVDIELVNRANGNRCHFFYLYRDG